MCLRIGSEQTTATIILQRRDAYPGWSTKCDWLSLMKLTVFRKYGP